ncbi:MAG: hypothetical protein ABW101_08425 [Candidatus Thiodiazotropha sp.]
MLRVAIEIVVAALILLGIYYLFAPSEEIELAPPLQESQIDPIIRAQIEAAGQAPVASTPSATPDNLSSTTLSEQSIDPAAERMQVSAAEPVPAQIPASPPEAGEKSVPEDARSLVSRLRSGSLTLNSTQIMERAAEYQTSGRPTDAYLLLFYAARNGNGPAAFALASLYDPNHFKPGNELLESADVFQAHKWYLEAEKQQVPGARERLQTLRSSIETQARSGDLSAQRLLLNWQ